MKYWAAILSVLLLLISCRQHPTLEPFRSGDLVFVGLPQEATSGQDTMDGAIAAATGDGNRLNLIHVAILEVDEADSLWIIDVTLKHEVKRDSLKNLFRDFTRHDGSLPEMLVMRLKDTTGVSGYLQKAKSFIGQPYDYEFMPDNGAMYCSELVYESYVRADGTHIFPAAPMNFKNAEGEFAPYWVRLFDRLQLPIPQDVMGTNPQAMYNSEALRPVRNSLPPR